MAHNQKGLNKYQRAMHRPGEHRVRSADVAIYLELAESADPEERLLAAKNLCPCHVRTGVEAVQAAIYRMMEDPDERVRWAAWHTLEDGGCPVNPTLDAIFERAVRSETDRQVRHFVDMFAVPRLREKETLALQRASRSPYAQRGKCDFCGAANVRVKTDYETEIGTGTPAHRFALICAECAATE